MKPELLATNGHAMTLARTGGSYEIRSQLGAGGMGEMYLAQDTRLDRKVAPEDYACLRMLLTAVFAERELDVSKLKNV